MQAFLGEPFGLMTDKKIYRLVRRGYFPSFGVASQRSFRRTMIDSWINMRAGITRAKLVGNNIELSRTGRGI